jgi:uncharacterized protein with GYD domain
LRFNRLSKPFYLLALLALLLAQAFPAQAEVSLEEAAGVMPDAVGEFRARGAASQPTMGTFELIKPEDFAVTGHATRGYVSPKGEAFGVEVIKSRSDSGAYALLLNQISPNQKARLDGVGMAAFAVANNVLFFKGTTFVRIYGTDKKPADREAVINFARLFADTLDKGENDVPALVRHLPEWETAWERNLSYSVSPGALKLAVRDQQVLDAVSFEGGTEAVAANYGQSHMVIVEFTTPQLATTNDARINAKLKELRDAGQSVPTAYRRVGNYAVFVFDAPDEATAVKLIESVKYEQVVQWLGPNPYDYQRAVKSYTNTTAGVIVAVLKASGLSLLLCLGVGAIFGGIVFKRRRQQQTVKEAFSDAGGMVRLNLDEVTQMEAQGKLLGPGKRR